MTRLFIIISGITFLSCNNANNSAGNKADTKPIEKRETFPVKELYIDKDEEEGWGADIRLSITEVSKNDTAITYFANSLHDTKNVGLKIIIPTALPANKKDLTQILTFESSGNISDNFIQTLSKLYKEKVDTPLHFVSSKRIAFIDLNEFAKAKLGQEPSNRTAAKEMKIFLETENEDDYSELYLNINEPEHWIEIREKDEEYRKQVIKYLTSE